ncbi:hypothetical protein DUNSADRAFT_6383 [Dunaliella salina]|uniref:Encoded protein n=1 Tax=Dunaliella salina TaxID=3046 RepID=A0ABQ7GND8_DUNSA|nr:hypothetical protein DUNSADRAFT_6383 [Dunaliella salina]|eukprot:KAF5836130.1 hypothetical protein DUNSADRAFT_6383 [Dunaliella salina]
MLQRSACGQDVREMHWSLPFRESPCNYKQHLPSCNEERHGFQGGRLLLVFDQITSMIKRVAQLLAIGPNRRNFSSCGCRTSEKHKALYKRKHLKSSFPLNFVGG